METERDKFPVTGNLSVFGPQIILYDRPTPHSSLKSLYLLVRNTNKVSYLEILLGAILKNSGLLTLMVSVPYIFVSNFCLQFVPFCLQAVIGDRMETEQRQNRDRMETIKCQ